MVVPKSTDDLQPQAGVEGDGFIRAALPGLALTVLMQSVVHITGRLDIIREAPRPKLPLFSGDASGGLTAEESAVVLNRCFDAIREWRDAGCPPPYRPTDAELLEMLDYVAGAKMHPRYIGLIKEELGTDGDARVFEWQQPVEKQTLEAFPVVIIGAGMSGLLMGLRLKQAGIPFTIIEKNDGIGGTWFENRYPGCRVDVPSHCYSFSFVRNFRWPNQFSPQPELRRYFDHCADEFGIRDNIRFGTQVLGAQFDAESSEWVVRLRDAGGERKVRARALISAVGQLNRPSIPKIEGEESFVGARFHTAQWCEDVPLQGKRIAVIGTAATAVQLVPELAQIAEHLTVIQRTPNWIIIHPQYRREIAAAEEWAFEALPFYSRWYRIMLFGWGIDGSTAAYKIDPAWPSNGLSVSAANEERRIRLTARIREVIGEDNHELLEKVIPKYPPFVKRPNPGDGGFYRALLRPNVDLVTERIEKIVPQGIVDSTGKLHEVDAIIYATGFKALDFLAPMDIRGLYGSTVKEFWGDDPGAYFGMMAPGFPNFFMMYGPGTNLGFNGNLIFNSECQARYIVQCIGYQIENQIPALQVKQSVYDDYAHRMEAALADFTWSHGSAGNWYKNSRGKVIANSPWPLIDYWDWTRVLQPDDFEIVSTTRSSASAPQSGDDKQIADAG
jgi:4-hydroxyacetophenone monooxygenase